MRSIFFLILEKELVITLRKLIGAAILIELVIPCSLNNGEKSRSIKDLFCIYIRNPIFWGIRDSKTILQKSFESLVKKQIFLKFLDASLGSSRNIHPQIGI